MTPPIRPTAPFWPTAVLLTLASAIYCAPLFFSVTNWGRGDWDVFLFRYETPRMALLRDHVLPTWNPYANGGTVLLAHPECPVLSPWYAIALLLGAPIGLRVQVFVFMALGAVGMAAFLARLGVSRAGGIAGGIVFMMSSNFALHIAEGHVEWCVLGLMPWVAIGILRLDEGRRAVILTAFILASALTFGTIYIVAVYLPFLTLWVVFQAIRRRQWPLMTRWAAVVVLAVLISAVKLVPTVAFASAYPRDRDSEPHVRPALLLTALFDPRQASLFQASRDRELTPGQFGKTLSDADATPLEHRLHSEKAFFGFHEYGCYIGFAGILLAAAGGALTLRRFWPLYAAAGFPAVIAVGGSRWFDPWVILQHVPLYSQLHVAPRFLAAIVFVLAVAAGHGLDEVAIRLRGTWQQWRRALVIFALACLYLELTHLGWTLFRDIFVIPPVALTEHATFAQRAGPLPGESVDESPLMYSRLYPRLLSNSGVIDGYENLQVSPGRVRSPGDPGYRGEVFLAESSGRIDEVRWAMSEVHARIATAGPEELILNQNFDPGWRARRVTATGHSDVVRASRSDDGLIAVAVDAQHTEVRLYYLPDSLILGAAVSVAAFVLCLVGLLWPGAKER